MTETPTQTEARAMHAAYVHATGLALPMDMARERAWVELLNRGFGPDDVRLVAAFIRRGIARARAGKPNPRNEGALRFRNFTALDQFEEDHAGAQLERAKYFTPAPAARAPSPPPADNIRARHPGRCARCAVGSAAERPSSGTAGAKGDSMSTQTATAPAVDQPRLVRRFRHSRRLDFEQPVRCHCGKDKLTVIDHRAPWYEPTASREWRYEVTCDTCLQCDANGYANRADVLAAYSANA